MDWLVVRILRISNGMIRRFLERRRSLSVWIARAYYGAGSVLGLAEMIAGRSGALDERRYFSFDFPSGTLLSRAPPSPSSRCSLRCNTLTELLHPHTLPIPRLTASPRTPLTLTTGPSRCFPFWQEVLACYVTNTTAEDDSGKAKCQPVLEDYYECLHHKKEVNTSPYTYPPPSS